MLISDSALRTTEDKAMLVPSGVKCPVAFMLDKKYAICDIVINVAITKSCPRY